MPQTQKRAKKAKNSLFLPSLLTISVILSLIRISQGRRVSVKNPANYKSVLKSRPLVWILYILSLYMHKSRQFSTTKNQGVRLKKSLGQNLLKDKNQIRKIVEFSGVGKKDAVLEIGPGLGALTLEMAPKAKKVLCVEKDKEMISSLETTLKENGVENVEVINDDILSLFKKGRLNVPRLKKYKVVANIPYYLTSFLIRNLLEIENLPEDIFLIIQREVGERICSRPGKMSILSVAVQHYASPKILLNIPRGCFVPSPKVDSVLIRITPKGTKRNDNFFKIVKAGFSHPRKQLVSNLSKELEIDRGIIEKWLEDNNLKPGERAEVLSLEHWKSLIWSIGEKA
jgi:16S rRNA (adenine1518-N6/adenine1519-N6)-dimethyltransferase